MAIVGNVGPGAHRVWPEREEAESEFIYGIRTRIIQVAQQKGWSTMDLKRHCESAGVCGKSTMGNYLARRNPRCPDLLILRRLAALLGIQLSWLIGGDR